MNSSNITTGILIVFGSVIALIFGKVILALTSPGNQHVPYRDSKLTRILQVCPCPV
jgi:hypothetical protein